MQMFLTPNNVQPRGSDGGQANLPSTVMIQV